jgi:hypothetical protein
VVDVTGPVRDQVGGQQVGRRPVAGHELHARRHRQVGRGPAGQVEGHDVRVPAQGRAPGHQRERQLGRPGQQPAGQIGQHPVDRAGGADHHVARPRPTFAGAGDAVQHWPAVLVGQLHAVDRHAAQDRP